MVYTEEPGVLSNIRAQRTSNCIHLEGRGLLVEGAVVDEFRPVVMSNS